MILYFSATGNTEFVATELSQLLGDECINLIERIKSDNDSSIYSYKPFVICTPVHMREMPRFLFNYLKNIALEGNKSVYFIFTCSENIGISANLAKQLMESKGLDYRGHAKFKMPNNYIIDSKYKPLDEVEIKDQLLDVIDDLGGVSDLIKSDKDLDKKYGSLLEMMITTPYNIAWYQLKSLQDDFYTNSKCMKCKKCISICPLNNIDFHNVIQMPIWKDNCSHCMSCVSNCPNEAIEYGDMLKSRDKYNFNKYKHLLN